MTFELALTGKLEINYTASLLQLLISKNIYVYTYMYMCIIVSIYSYVAIVPFLLASYSRV